MEIEVKISAATVKRTIDIVYDFDNDSDVIAQEFFTQDEKTILSAKSVLQLAIYTNSPKFLCVVCAQKIKINGCISKLR